MTDKTAWEGHTPLPWSLDGNSVEAKNGKWRFWADVGCSGVGPNPSGNTSHRELAANAALIVHCVNNFPALEAERDALREALDMCRAIIKFHVKNAGASCTMGDKTFSALDAFNAAVKALAISEKSE